MAEHAEIRLSNIRGRGVGVSIARKPEDLPNLAGRASGRISWCFGCPNPQQLRNKQGFR
ncbi:MULTISPECIES: hypothetical protein [unclassified Microcoleus]|uniref:hypothetical protein n=1 Tax=unclassified Microcoleus TaxID=2642155 RepID=UPI001D57022B|nr:MULTISPECIES: hypothetical protein [unclassified Microcoleus]MCC3442529.1 hypothetical protein [Microcoleus sp. PH2017_03_ELD_O_A]MCC3445839.1 hypothetical protein [Microcoleus sp. PH2017_09_SFU_O_A]MCC3466026.1 hypothetical protein [Microcoleus sp. PH2017_06_SFM_O_A]MCC3504305.1 hypothetical protein [Microcoleus sp. PH2017_19_SFW_U_A]MCC3513196.1 hypothetical protein [Microcoleus sp. PH2017_17_BER_D_A]MCC3522017.1 hypothetical protein [Microcoleus sp. PH2017_20_SFW_D_A]MCC3553015.1 hypot